MNHRCATLGPPEHAERSVQTPERATPHRRAVEVTDCRIHNEDESQSLNKNMPGLVQVSSTTANELLGGDLYQPITNLP